MNGAVLRMNSKTSKQYDEEMDYFIIKSLDEKNAGYNELFRLVKEKYNRHISDDTFDRHITHLKISGWIDKDTKFTPFYLTEKCKQQLKLGTLKLVSPVPKLNESISLSAQLAIKRINVYILLLLFRSGSSYEFAKVEELEYFLFRLGLSKNSLVMKSPHGPLHKSKNEVYSMAVFEPEDGRFSVHERRYVSSPRRLRDSISFICNIKGVKFPLTRYRSEPFRKMGVTQDEIMNSLSLLTNGGILQEPTVYLGDNIYLAADLQLYDLLSVYAYLYEISRSTLKKLWKLRKPIPEEIQWLKRIEGDSEVTRLIARSQEYRRRIDGTYYRRVELIRDLIKKTSETETKELTTKEKKDLKKHREWKEDQETSETGTKELTTMKEWIEKEYKETLSNPRYHFIIREIEKIAFPDWFQRIRMKLS
jgi:hypothetical protein